MKYDEMTIEEFLAWKSGDFDEYKELLTRKHWLESHIRGASLRRYDAEDSMGVVCDDEHYDSLYLKYKSEYDKETAKLEKYEKEWNEINRKLLSYTSK